MVLRKLQETDREKLEELINIIEASLVNKDWWLPIDSISRVKFISEGHSEFYGVFDGELLVAAFALFYTDAEWKESANYLGLTDSNIIELGRLMVRPECRGKGVLLSPIRETIRELGNIEKRKIIATAHPDNIGSQKLLCKCGFTKQGTYQKKNGYVRDVFLNTIE